MSTSKILNHKIRKILQKRNLSPSTFADEIKVQRSSISHILSDRNKPSLDIIQKIIKRYPELNYEWFMDENAYSEVPGNETIKDNSPDKVVEDLKNQFNRRPSYKQDDSYSFQEFSSLSQAVGNYNHKKIAKVIIVFADKTIEEFNCM